MGTTSSDSQIERTVEAKNTGFDQSEDKKKKKEKKKKKKKKSRQFSHWLLIGRNQCFGVYCELELGIGLRSVM